VHLLSLRRAKGAFSRHRALTAFAAVLSASALTVGLSVTPASADGFTPYRFYTWTIKDYGKGGCLGMNYGGGLQTFFPEFETCARDPQMRWTLYTTPYGGFNLVSGIQYQGQNMCLDGNQGGAYVNPCNWNNPWQTWIFGRGADGVSGTYTIMNYETNQIGPPAYCLDNNDYQNVFTSSCNWSNWNQNWQMTVVGN
jgi:hypothetical protein